jgi:flagellar secretion chaperone FliS
MNIRQSYREGVVGGATPIDLVVRLYEQMIEDMRHVGIAIEQNDIERRTSRINHAILIIAHLQSSLDFENGGKVAGDLNTFYTAMRQNVQWVQFHPSKRAATQVITDLLAVREAWIQVARDEKPSIAIVTEEVDRSERPSYAPRPRVAGYGDIGAAPELDPMRGQWKG